MSVIEQTVATKERAEYPDCLTCGHKTCPAWCGHAPPGDWLAHAACGDVDPETFFPTGTSGPSPMTLVKEAKRICNACPVKSECLDYAISEDLDHGVWGGTTPQDRRYHRKALVETLRKRRANERRLAEAL